MVNLQFYYGVLHATYKVCDLVSGVTNDPSKTFYFGDVLNFIFKRT